VELYTTLKEAYPSHGLEIVFVSSDRDEDSFNRYFSTMPWLAVPYDRLSSLKQSLSAKYSVRGIPSLVVVDSISGRVVINNTESRALVMQTCQGGTDESICSMFSNHWLSKIPAESQQLINLLAMSNVELCDDRVDAKARTEFCSVLVRNQFMEQQKRVEMLTCQLLEDQDGEIDEVEAYETAKQAVELSMADFDDNIKESCLDGLFECIVISDISTQGYSSTLPAKIAEEILRTNGMAQLVMVITTILKYFNNCYMEPWNPKYRKFQLSFRVADSITKVDGSIELILSMGFDIYCTTEDYVAYIPIPMDLDQMKRSITSLCTKFSVTSGTGSR
jgi:Thioredoxin-like/PUB domain